MPPVGVRLTSKKARRLPGFSVEPPSYFVSAFFSALALDFFSPLALAFFSVFFSVFSAALGAVSDLGAWANAVSANADASNATSSFFISILQELLNDPQTDLERITCGAPEG